MANWPSWEHFPHGADIGVRGRGSTMDSAFANAGMALTAIVTDLSEVERHESVEVDCENEDREILLVDFLNAVIFQMSTRHMLYSKYLVSIDGARLHAVIVGETVNVKRHQPSVEPKAATFTELRVAQAPDGLWCAQCVVDV